MKLSRIALMAVAAITLVACGDKAKEKPIEKPTLTFSASEISVPIDGNGTVGLKVTPAETMSDISYTIADESVATYEVKERKTDSLVFQFSAKAIGSTTMAVASGDLIATCTINVVPVGVTGISLSKTSVSIPVYAADTLGVTITPLNATSPMVSWSSSDEAVATVSGGIIKAVAPGSATITARSSDKTAVCQVTVYEVKAQSIALNTVSKSMVENETYILNATILPADVTYKNVSWTVSNESVVKVEPFDANEKDNIVSAKITAKKFTDASETKTASVSVSIGTFSAKCDLEISKSVVPAEGPKVGDYYYSDGTWSDGGLISMNKDASKVVWADVKPAPISGKTVIGIVFVTDTTRLAKEHLEAGHNHGLVFGLKAAHSQEDSLTRYTLDSGIDVIGSHTLGSSCYDDIFGYRWTQRILAAYQGKIDQAPAFDWVTTDFSPSAPANTSDWFVPSIGQLYDLAKNLGGSEIAKYINEISTYDYDVTYLDAAKLSYNPVEKLNSAWALVPDSMKEDLVYTIINRSVGSNPTKFNVCELMSSTIYQSGEDGTLCELWMGTNGEFQSMAGWVNDRIVCHPILAF